MLLILEMVPSAVLGLGITHNSFGRIPHTLDAAGVSSSIADSTTTLRTFLSVTMVHLQTSGNSQFTILPMKPVIVPALDATPKQDCVRPTVSQMSS